MYPLSPGLSTRPPPEIDQGLSPVSCQKAMPSTNRTTNTFPFCLACRQTQTAQAEKPNSTTKSSQVHKMTVASAARQIQFQLPCLARPCSPCSPAQEPEYDLPDSFLTSVVAQMDRCSGLALPPPLTHAQSAQTSTTTMGSIIPIPARLARLWRCCGEGFQSPFFFNIHAGERCFQVE